MSTSHPALETNPAIIESVSELWGLPLQPAGCPVCGVVHLVPANRLGQACPNCARGRLTPQPAMLRPEPPEKIVLPSIGNKDLQTVLLNFTKGVWLAPDDFNVNDLVRRSVAVYWPMWLVDADLQGAWKAEMGYDYQVKSSQESFRNGDWNTREVVENRIRWEPRLGQLDRHYDNVSAPAMSHHDKLWRLLGSYDLSRSKPYEPDKLGQAILRVPDLLPDNAWPIARQALDRAAGEDCMRASEAQHVRDYTIQASYEKPVFTQMLLPMYLTYYTNDAGEPQMVAVNAQTGKVGGVRLASQRKGWRLAGILAGSAALLFILTILSFLLVPVFPPGAIIGALLGVLAFGLAIAALFPAVWPWQWNRKQQAGKVILG